LTEIGSFTAQRGLASRDSNLIARIGYLPLAAVTIIPHNYFLRRTIVGFQISGLSRQQFQGFFDLDDDELAARGAKRYVADKKPGFPCRVSLADADPGEKVILLPFSHQPSSTPYQAIGPIFVREAAQDCLLGPNQVPDLLRTRLLSVRAYDAENILTDADVVEGNEIEMLLHRFFDNPLVSYLHVHFARPGCFACRVDRS
jgi:uncharacterized protein DUF1203